MEYTRPDKLLVVGSIVFTIQWSQNFRACLEPRKGKEEEKKGKEVERNIIVLCIVIFPSCFLPKQTRESKL